MADVTEYFGDLVFDERQMRARLAPEVYASLHRTVSEGQRLDASLAEEVAQAMRDWAVEKGATHFTHWFQPMTGVTAEKHDSFIAPRGDGGVIMELSGRELIQGEPDASSFPSGGLRATFEARGYTVWDASSYAFIKENTLCVPTAFCSYNGQALDKKTPLLRSMDAINRASLRVLRLFGNTETKRVVASVGAEQEYFLIDREVFKKRRDLVYTNRTLFGARPPKGQEMDDHYFGAIKPRVAAFMADLDRELWRLGILAKTEHNEEAPGQHELAVIYTGAVIATDQNQLIMEIMQKLAPEHGLVCLLHEKPFAGVNGSGKHNNWSLTTDSGTNLLSPGETPEENAQFLLFLSAVIRAVDEYQDLLRLAVATAGNDLRLGANEAPPAVISIFLGDELTNILESIADNRTYTGVRKRTMRLGADALPRLTQDTTDRNRTSPFAFTGNKFEFRMVGSSNSIACANAMLNSAVSSVLLDFADRLEQAEDFEQELHALLGETFREHRRIVFNGNGYDEDWIREAVNVRGLHNYPTVPDCMPHIIDEKNVQMLTGLKVYSETELRSRLEINLDNYCKTVKIEARTMIEMMHKEILPAVEKYANFIAESIAKKHAVLKGIGTGFEEKLLKNLSVLTESIDRKTARLEGYMEEQRKKEGVIQLSCYIRDYILPAMQDLRRDADRAESLTAREYWPFPTYGDIFFSVS